MERRDPTAVLPDRTQHLDHTERPDRTELHHPRGALLDRRWLPDPMEGPDRTRLRDHTELPGRTVLRDPTAHPDQARSDRTAHPDLAHPVQAHLVLAHRDRTAHQDQGRRDRQACLGSKACLDCMVRPVRRVHLARTGAQGRRGRLEFPGRRESTRRTGLRRRRSRPGR
jgi:hypothetical protein